nr:MAG TPA: hypothetical protein [Caudoviricetes sp.]
MVHPFLVYRKRTTTIIFCKYSFDINVDFKLLIFCLAFAKLELFS